MSWLSILGLLLAFLLAATLIGMRLPKTHAAASRIRLPVPREPLWEILTNFTDHPRWRPGLERVEMGPKLNGHPTWYEFCGRDLRVQFEVAVSEPPNLMVTRLVGEKLPLSGTWRYELVADGDGTVLTVTESERIYSPLWRFIARYLLSYHAAMDVFLIALARHLGTDATPEHLSLQPEDEGIRPKSVSP
jgi:hypothetical protein